MKKKNHVVRDMKECFRSFHLPVKDDQRGKDRHLAFTSQICNDQVCAMVAVTYDKQAGYVGIDTSFFPKVPADKVPEISQLLNLLNGYRPICSYSICHCCNTVSLQYGLFLSGLALPVGKFKRLLHDMLEESYLAFPLIAQVIKDGNPEELHRRFMDDHRDLLKGKGGLLKEAKNNILQDMESVIAGLSISIKEDDRIDNGFVIDCMLPDMDFPLRVGVSLNNENEAIDISFGPQFTVPDDNLPVMTELVNRINRMTGAEHFFITNQSNRVILLKGVMIDNGALDKKEFEKALRTMFGSGHMFFPIINEQLSSNESPEVLLAKIKANYKASH